MTRFDTQHRDSSFLPLHLLQNNRHLLRAPWENKLPGWFCAPSQRSTIMRFGDIEDHFSSCIKALAHGHCNQPRLMLCHSGRSLQGKYQERARARLHCSSMIKHVAVQFSRFAVSQSETRRAYLFSTNFSRSLQSARNSTQAITADSALF